MRNFIIYFVFLIALIACLSETSEVGFYEPKSIIWVNQGWSEEERDYWHHLNAGQEFAPLSWFKALESPDSNLMMTDPAYLRSLGFLDKAATNNNPEGLPIGFSIKLPEGNGRTMVGLNCASCHTGQINYKGKALRIDGASAGFNIQQFFIDYNVALAKTVQDSSSWNKFASRVLALEPGEESALRNEVEEWIRLAKWENEAFAKLSTKSVDPGHGRMDPFNRIANEVFGLGLREQSNYYANDGPVGVPYLWDIARLDWVHYNASFNQRVSRNILQVLGNGGRTYFLDENGNVKEGSEKWKSSFDIEGLIEMEEGYATLNAPEWPDQLLGKIDMKKAKMGRELFMQNCASCHAPKPILGSNPNKPDLAVVTVPVSIIGTDPNEAEGFASKKYDASKLLGEGTPPISGAEGLALVTSEMAKYAFNELGWTEEQIAVAHGDDRPNLVRGIAAYKARPLDGIWSTPPYLHNGSVPNLYELLSPPSERSVTFWLGTYEYDPVKVGYESKEGPKSFLFDTRLSGNLNSGHAFTNDPNVAGVIGREFTPEERFQIIEYLKVMTSMPPDPQELVSRSWD